MSLPSEEPRTRWTLRLVRTTDSEEIARARRRDLDIPRDRAAALAHETVGAMTRGTYLMADGTTVGWGPLVDAARARKISIDPDAPLPRSLPTSFDETKVAVENATSLAAARAMGEDGRRPLVLNFANGVEPGGGFLSGARAQEEALCRASALFVTLNGDPMYTAHRKLRRGESSAWAILSPDVPVFRDDAGVPLDEPWLADFVTCAAPYAPLFSVDESRQMLRDRIHRVLAIATAYGYEDLVLGAWGCGAFGNDPGTTAEDFRQELEGEFAGRFNEVVFAVCDWSPERRFLGPFRDTFEARRTNP